MTKLETEKKTIAVTLGELVKNAEAMTALLITKEGTGLAEAGDTSYLNTTAMAALVAGMFSATREVARLVGEEQFSILLQQGETRHIHISLITDRAMLVVVFEEYQRIGRVRHEAKKVGNQIIELLEPGDKESEAKDDIQLPEFKEYALNLIDRIFAS